MTAEPMPAPFTAMSALQFGMQRFSEESGYCFKFTLLIECLSIISAAMMSFCFISAAQTIFSLDAPPPESFAVTFFFAYMVIRTAAQSIVNRWLLLVCDGERITMDELFGIDMAFHLPGILKLMAASIIYSFYCIAGTLLLVIPGLFAASTLRFYRFLIVDRDADAVQGLRESYLISEGHKAELFGLSILCTLVKLVGLCVFGIGYIPASAVCGIAEAYAYRQLTHENVEQTAVQTAHLD